MLPQSVRPNNLDEFIGNGAAKAAIRRALDSDRRAHVYLLYGPSGCGKTTLARIFAREIGCEIFNIVELNAASRRGIEMARELERNGNTSPIGGGNRAVILDECHMLTREAQNALLKVLEDVPPFAYYFLCSTEPQKVLETIRTRAESIAVSHLSEDDMLEVAVTGCDRAGMDPPGDAVLEKIVEIADGCPRVALMLLEKASGLAEADALDVVGKASVEGRSLRDLCAAIVNGKTWGAIVKTYNELENHDPEAVRRSVLGYLKSCLLRAKGNEAGRFAAGIEELCESAWLVGEPHLLAALYRAREAMRG